MKLVRVTRIFPVEYVAEDNGVLRSQIAFVTPTGVKALSTARFGADDEIRTILLPIDRILSDMILAQLQAEVGVEAANDERA